MSNPASPIKRKRESSSGSSSKSPKVESSDGKGESKNGGKKAPAKQWTGEERVMLLEEVVKAGAAHADWARVGAECSGRTGVQARDQWRQILLPKIKQQVLLGLPGRGGSAADAK